MYRRRVALVFIHQEALSFGAHQNASTRDLDLFPSDSRRIIASRSHRSLVHQIRELSTGEARSSTSDPLQIEALFEFQVACMNSHNRFATGNIREVNRDLTIETSGTRQCFVENIRPVS